MGKTTPQSATELIPPSVIVPVISLLNRRQTHHYQTFPPLDTTYWLVGTLEARMMKSEILIVCHPDRVVLLTRLPDLPSKKPR